MGRGINRLWMVGVLAGLVAWMAASNTGTGDWAADAYPAVEPLIGGHLSRYLAAQTMMGPLPPLVQAPFAALGSTLTSQYQWASATGLIAAAALGLYLAEVARRRGASAPKRFLLALLPLLNPLTFAALQIGHPEEILTASLAIAAIVAAAERHGTIAGLLLGLAIASKQWAVVAALPVLLVLPAGRLRSGATALGVAAVLYLPGLIAAPSTFLTVQNAAGSGGGIASNWSLWYPFTHLDVRHLGHGLTGYVHQLPPGVEPLTHPLIAAIVILAPLALCLWRGRFLLTGEEAFALLALLGLLRCVLDPENNVYYHELLLMALFGWDTLGRDRLPYRSLAGAAIALLVWKWSQRLDDPALFNAVYLAIMLPAALAIAATLLRRRGPAAATRGVAPALS